MITVIVLICYAVTLSNLTVSHHFNLPIELQSSSLCIGTFTKDLKVTSLAARAYEDSV